MEPGVRAYLGGISSPNRRRDAETMVELMRRATGEEPQMWGSIVGFGHYHYKYASGREGDSAAAGFSARKAATTVDVADGVGAHAELLDRLGPPPSRAAPTRSGPAKAARAGHRRPGDDPGVMCSTAERVVLVAEREIEMYCCDRGSRAIAGRRTLKSTRGGRTARIAASVRAGRSTQSDRRGHQAPAAVASERFRTSYIDSPSGLVLLLPDGTILLANPAAGRFVERDESDLLGGRMLDLVVPEDRERAKAALASVIAGEDDRVGFVVRLAGRSPVSTAMTASLVRQRNGLPLFVVVHIEDRSAHVDLLTQLGQAHGLALIGIHAGGLMHDLDNALCVLRGYAELLSRGIEDESLRSPFAIMSEAAERASLLAARLLDVGRPTDLVPQRVDVGQLAASMTPVLEALIRRAGRFDFESDAGTVVEIDPIDIERVLLTLVSNAIDAIRPSGSVSVEVRNVGTAVVLRVTDDGVGMDAVTLARAVEPFFTTKGRAGVGLGLSTARSTIESFGGALEIRSEPDRGTIVEVVLPAAASGGRTCFERGSVADLSLQAVDHGGDGGEDRLRRERVVGVDELEHGDSGPVP